MAHRTSFAEKYRKINTMPQGPCIMCGATNYSLSYGGPNICPSCDCGIPPEVTKLRGQMSEANLKIIELMQENEHIKGALLEAANTQNKPCCQAVRLLNKVNSATWRCPVCHSEV